MRRQAGLEEMMGKKGREQEIEEERNRSEERRRSDDVAVMPWSLTIIMLILSSILSSLRPMSS